MIYDKVLQQSKNAYLSRFLPKYIDKCCQTKYILYEIILISVQKYDDKVVEAAMLLPARFFMDRVFLFIKIIDLYRK